LSGQINERKKYIETIEQDVKIIQTEVSRLQVELKALQRELADKKKKYE
jgi:regulator of replication initiation timing